MPFLNRRHFLQGAGATLATLGLNQIQLTHQAHRYGQVLAQPTRRKLALLVGINNYPTLGRGRGLDALKGPENDLDLQYQLLVHRFGFQDGDIRILESAQATRDGILQAYEQHLIAQARPGDVVVFHFSGHGDRVKELEQGRVGFKCDFEDCNNSSIVPYDSNQSDRPDQVNDILGHTRFLLDSLLQTENLTVILDCCYSGGGKRGNIIVRARNVALGDPDRIIADTELAYQQTLLDRLGWTPEEFIRRRQEKVAKGVVITAAARNQKSADYPFFNQFYAGAFTYLLTKYLWQQTESQSVRTVIPLVARSTFHLANHSQQPEYEAVSEQKEEESLIDSSLTQTVAGEGVITKDLTNNRVKLWLGGLDTQSLEAFDEGAVFALIDRTSGDIKGTVSQDRGRKGLETEGTVSLNKNQRVAVGDLLQERVRNLPHELSLRVGLDPSLWENSDSQAAEIAQKLDQSLDFLEPVAVQAGNPVDCLLGRWTQTDSIPPEMRPEFPEGIAFGSFGLFNAGRGPLPGSFGAGGESIDAALIRLQPRFKSLLISRILHIILNAETATLNVSLEVGTPQRSRGIPIRATTRGHRRRSQVSPSQTQLSTTNANGIPDLKAGETIDIKLINQEPDDLYMSLLVIDAQNQVNILFPGNWDSPEAESLVAAGQSKSFPKLRAVPPFGLAELLVIASTQPLRQTLKTLQAEVRGQRGSTTLQDPKSLLTALTQDFEGLGTTTVSRTRGSGSPVDTQKVAVVSLLYTIEPQ